MNKYFIKIPYSYTQYAELTGIVYAENEEEAEELATEDWNIHEESYDDKDSSGDSDFDYDYMEVTLEESNIHAQEIPQRNSANHFTSAKSNLPCYFLEDLPALAEL